VHGGKKGKGTENDTGNHHCREGVPGEGTQRADRYMGKEKTAGGKRERKGGAVGGLNPIKKEWEENENRG